MHISFLNIKKVFFPLYGRAFFVRLVVNKILAFICISALLISKLFLTLPIVKTLFFNIRESVSAKFNFTPKAPDFQELFFYNRL